MEGDLGVGRSIGDLGEKDATPSPPFPCESRGCSEAENDVTTFDQAFEVDFWKLGASSLWMTGGP